MGLFSEGHTYKMCRGLMIIAFVFVFLASFAAEPIIDCVQVTAYCAPNNPVVRVWYRVPSGYNASSRKCYRVLVLFGGRNADGKGEVSGKLGWTNWADLNDVFLVSPSFKDDNYWDPSKWSGKAFWDAICQMRRKYNIATRGLLYYGYSAGSQASNLFPSWRPDLCRAYVSHACGLFHTPSSRMKTVAGLVTCGDADLARFALGRKFVESYKRLGVSIIWKSFPNHPHDVPPASVQLAQEFLAHYHWRHLEDLGGESILASKVMTFVGDDADGIFYRSSSKEVDDITENDRVILPSANIAYAWGSPCQLVREEMREVHLETNILEGVEVVYALPRIVRTNARILLLLGGKGWAGIKTINETGFLEWVFKQGWCLIAPSFSKDGYWFPKNEATRIVKLAVDNLYKNFGIRPYPFFVFGYSAGGQLASHLQEATPLSIAGWAVYGCGVYPECPMSQVPGLIMCGEEDTARYYTSRRFVHMAREAGAPILWKGYRQVSHQLYAPALELAKKWLSESEKSVRSQLWGEDDTYKIGEKDTIEKAYRNPLLNEQIYQHWLMP